LAEHLLPSALRKALTAVADAVESGDYTALYTRTEKLRANTIAAIEWIRAMVAATDVIDDDTDDDDECADDT